LYGDYPDYAVTNPTGPSTGVDRVYRGGSWDYNAPNCRVASRNNLINPSYYDDNLGFRVAFYVN
jgi:formylglycine-generating enzyme required for sulfatase activity